jgi:hypothetical protein
MSAGHAWCQRAVIYQAYPRSFLDTDGESIGRSASLREQTDGRSASAARRAIGKRAALTQPASDAAPASSNWIATAESN